MRLTSVKKQTMTNSYEACQNSTGIESGAETFSSEAVTNARDTLAVFLRHGNSSPFNYERYLLVEKALYLDAFLENSQFPPFEVELQIKSTCNLRCKWCIGEQLQAENHILHLPERITSQNIDNITEGIIAFRLHGLGIQRVKFSGFTGEPLLAKDLFLRAARRLATSGIGVALFTNGILLDPDRELLDTLVQTDYVHVSLDAGPLTYNLLKRPICGTKQNLFYRVLKNIESLAIHRATVGSRMRLNIGYVVVPENFHELYEAARLVREAGADSIRFKCDIAGNYDLQKAGVTVEAFEQIQKTRSNLAIHPSFTVHTIHTEDDVERKAYTTWQSKNGCLFQHFCTTIGSDGNVYLCDHNTIAGATPLGNIINESFEQVWLSQHRKYIAAGVQYLCRSPVCPPMANRVNPFLAKLQSLVFQYGLSNVKKAIEILRQEYS
jgi:sulfatase maturation enzyme AslB (radical SAM superfamily)